MQRSGLKGGAVEVGKSVGISVIVTLAAVLLFAFLIKIFSIGASVITPVNQVIKALAIFLGCLLVAARYQGLAQRRDRGDTGHFVHLFHFRHHRGGDLVRAFQRAGIFIRGRRGRHQRRHRRQFARRAAVKNAWPFFPRIVYNIGKARKRRCIMNKIKTIARPAERKITAAANAEAPGQSACKTSCTVGNQSCERISRENDPEKNN